jgi:predicted RNA-binding Zn-ribbon protein involved in translation (DUF1610 family)
MALFRITCDSCGLKAARLGDTEADALKKSCPSCGSQVKREATGLSATLKECLDNGVMPRALERLADAERLYRDRAQASDPLAGTSHKKSDL